MRIYFVRHGETEANKTDIVQDSQGFLSESGRKQAEFVADRLSTLPVSLIVSSTFDRTKKTTEIINNKFNKKVIFSDLFIERCDPSEIVGKSIESPEAQPIIKKIRRNRHIPDWKYSDEESFGELKERAEKALEYLISLNTDNVLVVTHSGIVRMLLASMVFGKLLTGEMYTHIFAFRTINTGITMVDYVPTEAPDRTGWRIQTWNDHAHLG